MAGTVPWVVCGRWWRHRSLSLSLRLVKAQAMQFSVIIRATVGTYVNYKSCQVVDDKRVFFAWCGERNSHERDTASSATISGFAHLEAAARR